MDIKKKRVERIAVIRWDGIVNHGSLLNHDVYHYFVKIFIYLFLEGEGVFGVSREIEN